MWNDIETTNDLLNFKVVADTAAELIKNSGNEPLSIGISGNWGTGKSSLVKMVGKSLSRDSDKKYLFLEFNAWLYQDFDDAKMALLQSVADILLEEAEKQKTFVEKAVDLGKRVRWFKAIKFIAPAAYGAVVGGTLAGPVGAAVGAFSGLFKGGNIPSEEELKKAHESYKKLEPELSNLLKEKEVASLPKEIEKLRDAFEEILSDLDVKLVVLVDDLDRCMPDTAISTLEAMRLLLFLPRTAFIIAADEKMIRNAVRSHFSSSQFDDELVTSYFDKLIQVPLRVPRLGISEVKAYMVLLLAELEVRRCNLSQSCFDSAKIEILNTLKQPWLGGLNNKKLTNAFGDEVENISKQIDIADQLAKIMATVEQLSGNPRLIKRFLNNLIIRESIATSQGMNISFEELVKLQLFERCASSAAFEFLSKKVAESEDGKPSFLYEIEEKLKKGEEYISPDQSWDNSFIQEWLEIEPLLSNIDLRPLLHLSRDRTISLAGVDELSLEAKSCYEALLAIEKPIIQQPLVEDIQTLGEIEASQLFNRLKRRIISEQWVKSALYAPFHIIKAYPNLNKLFIQLLSEIPPKKRHPSFVPKLLNEIWAKETLINWKRDPETPTRTIKAIELKIKDN